MTIRTLDTSMTHDGEAEAVHYQARQMGKVLLSFVLAAFAAWLLWKFGEPMSLRKFGIGAPGWIYPLLFIRPVFLCVQLLGDPPASPKPARDWMFSTSVPDDPLPP